MSAPAVSPYEITVCRGMQAETNCRFAMKTAAGFGERLEQAVQQSGWPAFLRNAITGPLLHHHAFRIALAACPNGCSRPHVADIGIIRACTPLLDSEACSCCGICYKVCPDRAITMERQGPVIDHAKCMQCGMCVAKCSERALSCHEDGYRIVLGGKLGRHPRLATEIGGVHGEQNVLAVVTGCLEVYMREYRKGLRFGVLVEELGERLDEELAVLMGK